MQMSSLMLETETYPTLQLSSPGRFELLPDAGSHEWSSEAKVVEFAQLIRLASQHHASEYSRLKFGPKGCPVVYVPFSFQMPERVRQLQAHQARYATRQAWWLCERRAATSTAIIVVAAESQDQPPLGCPTSIPDIQQEIHAAISSTLVPPSGFISTFQDQPSIKTSGSHPINVSPIIPLDVLRMISLHLSRNDSDSPIMFDLPHTHFLDRIITMAGGPVASPSLSRPYPCPTSMAELIPCSPMHSLARSGRLSHFLWNNPTLRRALQLTASSHGKRPRPLSTTTPSETDPVMTARTANASSEYLHAEVSPAKDSLRRSHSTSSVLTRPTSDTSQSIGASATCEGLGTLPKQRRSNSYSDLRARLAAPPLEASSSGLPPVPPLVPEPWSLGNLYLSSCPGKKVRLNGPVKGKCGVCRDLRMDLQRIKDYGVTCIVCCLDDEELELLGVPWSEYSSTADDLGLDVLRIPTPEGLTPASISDFDAQLTKLIKSYTLNGKHVLAHCRGGVGRAGLVACCWVLKLGLCGWIDASAMAFTASEQLFSMGAQMVDTAPAIGEETLQLLERVITVVRRRRSPKALETYEQVRFLADFVRYQRRRPVQIDDAHLSQQDLLGCVD
ncbi:phosphatases II [Rhodofomes roseus]|uniref:Phosphatases II n=1 Tax=Rhodofomes roseus TaxID=34475 RepID=A0ABQ8K314_9APHY|nr:phosphatases II [Rhodofomes roseus]KAH9830745.1 phosphatases II [Rhodofomes roseus]